MTPVRYAAILTLGYVAVAAAYILVSSDLAAAVSQDVHDLQRLETFKGIGFVTVTGVLLFGASWGLFRRLEHALTTLARARDTLLVNERRVFAGVMAASIAHDGNNVLTGLLAAVEDAAAADTPPDEREDAFQRLNAALRRLVELNQRLLTAGRQTLTGETRSLGLASLVRDCVLYVQGHPSVRGCRLDLALEGPATVEGHAVLLHQMVGNLILNAGEATGGKGRIEVRLAQADAEVVLEVHDNGPGVPEERRAGIFEALQTTKASGSGLGLFSVKACVDTHGGTVLVTTSQLGGACFRVRLPRRASQRLDGSTGVAATLAAVRV